MLPVEKGKGEIWQQGDFLCAVEYEISEPLSSTAGAQVQRVILTAADEHSAALLDASDLVLIIADRTRYALPRPLHGGFHGVLEYYIESLD